MGSSPAASPEFLAAFRAQADANGILTFADFMALALYDPHVGYYRQNRRRIGYGRGTDFFTASSSPLFGELVAAAAAQRLRDAGRTPETHTFVEIGAEPDGGVLAGVSHPFASSRTLRLGDALRLEGDCVVFSNELFDAQPCVRTVFRDGRWREFGVQLVGDVLREVELPCGFADPEGREGYELDRPLAAVALLEQLAARSWSGLFLAFDYGKTWHQLAHETPRGTVRAYFRHTQSNDLLARPGEQDLTCHVCWDWLEEALRRHGFNGPTVDWQETFFVRQAGEFIAATSAAEAARFSPRKLALLQLLHPGHMGQKFQVLHAVR
jgi:SAM-dependent MidA family methyltransferase